MKYQLTKVYKLSEMPKEIQQFFSYVEESYIDFLIVEAESSKPLQLINDYLQVNGSEMNEKVIIDLIN